MRRLVVGLALGMVLPALSAAQSLGPRTLLPLHVACAELPVTAGPTSTIRIDGVQRADARQSLAPGDIAVIKRGNAEIAVGQAFLARRLDGGRDAFRRGVEGYAGLRTAGILTVVAVDERFALARVDRACAEVMVGDALEPLALPTLPAADPPGLPVFDDRARVLFGADLRLSFGDGDLLAFNRGSTHGVTPGTRVGIYREPAARATMAGALTPGLPLVELGEAVVLDVTETTARAVVVRAMDAIVGGDVVVRVPASRP